MRTMHGLRYGLTCGLMASSDLPRPDSQEPALHLLHRRARMLGHAALLAQHVANAPHGMNQVGLASCVELLPQVSHVDLDRVALALEVGAPDLLQQLTMREHLAAMLHQALQQVEFPRAQPER